MSRRHMFLHSSAPRLLGSPNPWTAHYHPRTHGGRRRGLLHHFLCYCVCIRRCLQRTLRPDGPQQSCGVQGHQPRLLEPLWKALSRRHREPTRRRRSHLRRLHGHRRHLAAHPPCCAAHLHLRGCSDVVAVRLDGAVPRGHHRDQGILWRPPSADIHLPTRLQTRSQVPRRVLMFRTKWEIANCPRATNCGAFRRARHFQGGQAVQGAAATDCRRHDQAP
mmetsp:Transcript_12395/g.26546  ORF Transcript_12395/g.26546 Transcript_12395/m.26546 type:complete len:220 (+) Transcript_12395:241-900(+)